jgi:hypothetical protein
LCLLGFAALRFLLGGRAGFLLGVAVRWLGPGLGLPLNRDADLVLGAAPRAHQDSHDRGCDRETNYEKHVHPG